METTEQIEAKDISENTKFLNLGNTHFKKKTALDYLIALKFYNKALCFAPTHSKLFYKSLDNRSSVYYRLEMYDICLDNINLIHKYGQCPSSIIAKLKLCEESCKNFITEGKLPKKFQPIEPELSFPASEELPNVVEGLQIHQNQLHGRYIVANRELQVGAMIACIEPLYAVLTSEYLRERCVNCRLENSQNLIPCPTCTAVMFCDEKCLTEAMESFHQYECPMIDSLLIMTPMENLVIRIFMSGLACFESIDTFLDFSTKALKKKSTKFTEKPNNEREKYALACSLSKLTTAEGLRIDTSLLITLCTDIFRIKNISSKKKPAEFKKMLKHIVQQILLMVNASYSGFEDLSNSIVSNRSNLDSENRRITGIYHFLKFLPHSCVPNTNLSQAGNREIVSILRPIKAGEPLTMNFYGQFHYMSLEERRYEMESACQCVACLEDYPQLEHLPMGSFEFLNEFEDIDGILYHYDRIKALSQYKLTIDALQNNDGEMPCQALINYSNHYNNIMNIIYCGNLSIALRALPDIEKIY